MFDDRRKPKVDVDLHHTAHSQTQAAWVSAIAAVLAFILSVVALYQASHARDESRREKVIVNAYRDFDFYPKALRQRNGAYYIPGTIETRWFLLVTNNGDKTISITHYEACTLVHEGSINLYTGYDLDHEKQSKQPAVKILPGESALLKVRIGTIGDSNALDRLNRLLARSPFSRTDPSNHQQEVAFRIHTGRYGEFGCHAQLSPTGARCSNQTTNSS